MGHARNLASPPHEAEAPDVAGQVAERFLQGRADVRPIPQRLVMNGDPHIEPTAPAVLRPGAADVAEFSSRRNDQQVDQYRVPIGEEVGFEACGLQLQHLTDRRANRAIAQRGSRL